MRLEVKPELRRRAKCLGQTLGRVRCDRSPFLAQPLNAGAGNMDMLRKLACRNAHLLKELMLENFAGMDRGFQHGHDGSFQ